MDAAAATTAAARTSGLRAALAASKQYLKAAQEQVESFAAPLKKYDNAMQALQTALGAPQPEPTQQQ